MTRLLEVIASRVLGEQDAAAAPCCGGSCQYETRCRNNIIERAYCCYDCQCRRSCGTWRRTNKPC